MKKYIALFAVSIENFKNLKYHAFSTKKYFLIFKDEQSIEILKALGLIKSI